MNEIETEADRISGKLVTATIFAAIVAVAASALVVYLLLSRVAHGGGASAYREPVVEPPADTFSLATLHERHRRAQTDALNRWQWANSEHTRVRMPLEMAIDRLLRGAR
jgi:hypothetical protein